MYINVGYKQKICDIGWNNNVHLIIMIVQLIYCVNYFKQQQKKATILL